MTDTGTRAPVDGNGTQTCPGANDKLYASRPAQS